MTQPLEKFGGRPRFKLQSTVPRRDRHSWLADDDLTALITRCKTVTGRPVLSTDHLFQLSQRSAAARAKHGARICSAWHFFLLYYMSRLADSLTTPLQVKLERGMSVTQITEYSTYVRWSAYAVC